MIQGIWPWRGAKTFDFYKSFDFYKTLDFQKKIYSVIGGIIFVLYCSLLAAPNAVSQSYNGPDLTYRYDGPRVTDAQVYNDPGNLELNLNYAKQEAARGELQSSASTLERLLLLEPNWHSARLFYAGVLYRLDDRQAALREIELLDKRKLTEYQRATLEDYKQAFQDAPPITAQTTIDGRSVSSLQQAQAEAAQTGAATTVVADDSTAHRFHGRLMAGLRYDDNAGNAITDASFAQSNEGDISAILQAAGRYDLTLSDDLKAHITANAQLRRHNEFSSSDYTTGSLRAGLTMGAHQVRIIAELLADKVILSGDDYLVQTGPRLALQFQPANKTQIMISGAYYEQDYEPLTIAPNEDLRSGEKGIWQVSGYHQLTDAMKLILAAGLENKSADISSFEYDGLRLNTAIEYKLINGHMLRGDLGLRRLSFTQGASGNSLIPTERQDRLNARVAYRLPLGSLLPIESLADRDEVKAEFSIHHNVRDNNLPGLDYNNSGAQLRMIWDF